MKMVLKNDKLRLEFQREYDFYNTGNCIVSKAVPKTVLFDIKDLDWLLDFDRRIGLPSFTFYCKDGGQLKVISGKGLKDAPKLHPEHLEFELLRSKDPKPANKPEPKEGQEDKPKKPRGRKKKVVESEK